MANAPDILARIHRALEARSAAGLTVWFVAPQDGRAVSISCANEEQRAGYLATLKERGRVLISDSGKAGLAAEYVRLIGYDPFADDPSIKEAEVAQILAEYLAARAAEAEGR